MNQQILNAVNTLLAALGLNATSLVPGTGLPPEQSSSFSGLVFFGNASPTGALPVTIVPTGGGTPVVLTFSSGDAVQIARLAEGSQHTVVYYSAAAQSATGIQSAYDRLLSIS